MWFVTRDKKQKSSKKKGIKHSETDNSFQLSCISTKNVWQKMTIMLKWWNFNTSESDSHFEMKFLKCLKCVCRSLFRSHLILSINSWRWWSWERLTIISTVTHWWKSIQKNYTNFIVKLIGKVLRFYTLQNESHFRWFRIDLDLETGTQDLSIKSCRVSANMWFL